MPKLNKENIINLLTEKINTMKGDTTLEILKKLNAKTQDGYIYNELSAEEVLNILGVETYNIIKDSNNEYAKLFLGYLEYPGTLNVGPNSKGDSVVNELVLAELLSENKKNELVEKAKVPNMSGLSWGESNGIGRIYFEFILQVKEEDE